MERGRRLIAQNDQPEATSVRRLIDHAMRGPERRICPPLKIPHTLCARVFRSRQRAVQDADAAAGHYDGPLPARGAETVAECRRLWHYQGTAVSLAKLCAPAKVGLVGRQRRAVWGRRLDFWLQEGVLAAYRRRRPAPVEPWRRERVPALRRVVLAPWLRPQSARGTRVLSDLWTQPPSLMTPLPRARRKVGGSLCFKGLFDRGRRLVRVLGVRLMYVRTFSLLGEKREGVVFSRPLRALRAA